jgi:hypothetical protein
VGLAAGIVAALASIEILVASVAGAWGGLSALTLGWTVILATEAVLMGPTVVRAVARGVTPVPEETRLG